MAQKSNNSQRSSFWGLNKLSFYTIATAACLYLVSAILSLIDATKLANAINTLQGFAAAIMISIVAVLAWKYARHKTTTWKVLYFVFLGLVIIGLIIPLVVG